MTNDVECAMKHPAWVAASLTLLLAPSANAQDWVTFDVSTWNEPPGTGAKAAGIVSDKHGTRSAQLVVVCAGQVTRVFVSADYLVFGGDIARAEYWIDNGPRQQAYWRICPGDLCAGLFGGTGIQFAKSLLDAAVLEVTLTRHFGEPIHATFPVRGARGALRDVGKQCKWMTP